MIDKRILNILTCPIDRSPLLPINEYWLYNPRLKLGYRMENKIAILLIEEILICYKTFKS